MQIYLNINHKYYEPQICWIDNVSRNIRLHTGHQVMISYQQQIVPGFTWILGLENINFSSELWLVAKPKNNNKGRYKIRW